MAGLIAALRRLASLRRSALRCIPALPRRRPVSARRHGDDALLPGAVPRTQGRNLRFPAHSLGMTAHDTGAGGCARKFTVALLISLVLHVVALIGLLKWSPATPTILVSSPDRLVLRLRPPPQEAPSPTAVSATGLASKSGRADRRPSQAATTPGQESMPSRPSSDANASDRPIVLEAVRESARKLARLGHQGESAGAAGDADAMARGTPLARAVARSARRDCRSAYASAGLLAIPALARDAVLDTGCEW